MDSIPAFSERDVRQRVGAASFDRSRSYVRGGALVDLRRQGRTLKASCYGSLPDPYRLHVIFDSDGITDADCSCPVGDGGFCKHVAALLQRWLDDPDAFAETAPIDDRLDRLSKEELAELIRLMIERYPDLEDLVAMPTPGRTHEPLEPALIERQVRRVFAGDLYEWGSAYRVGRDLERIAQQADAYARHGDWASTHTICQTLIDSLMEHYEMLHDENGDVAEVVNVCVGHLGRILEHAEDDALRTDVVGLLYEVMRWDVALGGIDLGWEAADFVRAHATAEERAALCDRISADLDRIDASGSGAGAWMSDWRRQALGGLLLSFQPDDTDDEAYLAVCRASGRTEDLVARLLALGRLDEALAAARPTSDYGLLGLIPHFLKHGHGDAIDALALDRLGDGTDRRLVEWLKERARERGDAELAQALAERLFLTAPSAERYAEAITLSRTLGREAAVREALRERLHAEQALGVLIDVHLHDGEPDEALRLAHRPAKAWRWPGERARACLRVAAAVADTHPEEAVQLYFDAATGRVEQRGRKSYAEAARLLLEARAIYHRRNRAEDWTLFIGEFRDAYKRLPALQDEFDKAGL